MLESLKMFSKKFMNRENLIKINKNYKNNLRNEKKLFFLKAKDLL